MTIPVNETATPTWMNSLPGMLPGTKNAVASTGPAAGQWQREDTRSQLPFKVLSSPTRRMNPRPRPGMVGGLSRIHGSPLKLTR